MSDSNQKPGWDLKQVATGAGSSALLLFMMQSQGVDLLTKNQQAQNSVVIEKTLANAQRIERLENEFSNLSNQMRRDFDGLRSLVKEETKGIASSLQIAAADRWTASQHKSYSHAVEARFELIEGRLRLISDEFSAIKRRNGN